MNSTRIIKQQEVGKCSECPFLIDQLEYGCLLSGDSASFTGVHPSCPLVKKEEMENRTCRNCRHLVVFNSVYIGSRLMDSMCDFYDINLDLQCHEKNYISSCKFVNDPNKHCWEERDE